MPRRTSSAGGKQQRPSRALGRSRDVKSQLYAIEADGGEGDLDFGAAGSLHVSSLGKVFFPDAGITKGGLMRYYTHVWPVLEAHVRDRPLILKRFPNGVGGPLFFQQNAGEHVPAGVRAESVGAKSRLIGGDLPTLLYTVQLGAIEVHPWLSRVTDVDHADRCVIDLDPGDDVDFAEVVRLTKAVVQLADNCRLPVAIKTSGARGMHVVIPLPARTSYDISATLATLMARVIAGRHRESATVERSIRARPNGTIYVDAMQNARGKSAASVYSVRPRPLASVSTPVLPRELTARLRIEAYTVGTVPARVVQMGDVWGEALAHRPSMSAVERAIKALEHVLDGAPAVAKAPRASRRITAGGAAGVGASRQRRSRRRS